MPISRSNMKQEIRLSPGKSGSKAGEAIKDSIISKAKRISTGSSKPNYKTRATRPGGYAGGGPTSRNSGKNSKG